MDQTIKTDCPHCAARLSVSSAKAGQTLKCPKCKSVVVVPTPDTPEQVTELPVLEEATFSVLRRERKPDPLESLAETLLCEFKRLVLDSVAFWTNGKTVARVGLVLSLFGWLNSYSAGDEYDFWCYPCIILTGIFVYFAFGFRHSRPRLTRFLAVFATVTVLYLWGAYDTTHEFWRTETTNYTDTYQRWSRQHLSREFAIRRPPEDPAPSSFDWWTFRGHGPMAGTGKPHGQWEYETNLGNFRTDRTIQFYWYGEEITEGEWHLRQRQ
jgi:phage FluMu protein Com